ncbi:MAG: signal peptidase I [Clostridiales bacterium]|jgi:signal peptidase I|nr:signal peptidase I [Clostridiales bacterium]
MEENSNIEQASTLPSKQNSTLKEILDWVIAILLAIVFAFVVRTYVFKLVLVEGPSMQPTLQSDDRLYVNRFFYTPKNGDIVVFKPESYPNTPFIKRVIATEGQTVDINFETGDVTVDGTVISEPYIKDATHLRGDMTFPQIVPADHVFVMGDNRNNSKDSRRTEVGMVSKKEIIGHALFRFWPFDSFGALNQ